MKTHQPAPPAAVSPARTTMSVAMTVAILHGMNDAYAAFIHPLLPRIMDRMGLSITLAATLAVTLALAASLLQPACGYLADRYGGRLFVVLGPAISAAFLSLIGVAPHFWVLVLFLAVGGVGSALFHPPGAALSTRISDGGASGLRLSLFSFGGAIGFALGPLIAVGLVARVGLEGLWIAMIPGLVVAAFLYFRIPSDRPHPDAAPPPSPLRVLKMLRGPLGVIFVISASGAFVQRVFLTMTPIIAAAEGVSEARGALMLSVYLGAQAGGTLTGGFLTDRCDRQRLLATLTLLAVPAHLLAFWLPAGSVAAMGVGALAGFVGMAILPPVVVMAQEMIPAGAGVGSGIAMGLAWAAGSIGVLGTGALGDWLGPRPAAMISVPVLLAGTMMALHPALRPHARSREGKGT